MIYNIFVELFQGPNFKNKTDKKCMVLQYSKIPLRFTYATKYRIFHGELHFQPEKIQPLMLYGDICWSLFCYQVETQALETEWYQKMD